MSMEQLVATVVLIGLLGVAVVSDLRRHRIPNLLVLLGLVLGLTSQAYASGFEGLGNACLLYTSPSPRDLSTSRMPSSA